LLSALDKLTALLGPARVRADGRQRDDWHDESLVAHWHARTWWSPPLLAEVAEIITIAREFRMPVTARGSGTGLAGACSPPRRDPGRVSRDERHPRNRRREPGRRRSTGRQPRELDEATAMHGLATVFPGRAARARRQRGDQRRRYARRQVRRHPHQVSGSRRCRHGRSSGPAANS